ncbi:MAG TPA: methionyl-tRNA formyltransferase, partial [Gammaproteobacteria bacterium]
MHRKLAEARIAFAGTPQFAVPTLEAIVAAGAHVPLVLTQPDRPAGRGRRLTASPVKERALALGLPLAQPPSLRAPAELPPGERPDVLVV